MSDIKITPPPVTPPAAQPQASSPAPAPVVPAVKPSDEFSFPELDFNKVLNAEHENAQTTVEQQPAPAAQPATEPQPDVTRPVATQPEVPATPAPQPEATPQPEPPKPAAEAQPAPAPRVIDPEQKVAIADGWPEYTIAQVRTGLENGVAAHQEAVAFRQMFGMTAEQASQSWAPLLTEIAGDPQMGEYLESAIDHYRAQKSQQPPQQPQPAAQPAVDPKFVARMNAVETELNQRKLAEAGAFIEQEKANLVGQFPALGDPDTMTDLINFAITRAVKDPSYTLSRAAQDRATYLARLAPQQPATAQIPALLSSGGPSPSGTTPAPLPEDDNVLSRGHDPVAEWQRERAAAGFR